MSDRNISLPKAIEDILVTEKTPILVIDKSIIRQKFQEFRSEFRDAILYFALKANPDPGVVELLNEIGCEFEISSHGELDHLLRLGTPVSKIISSNPVKPPAFIKAAHECGIEIFTFDSLTEIDKLADNAPGCKVYIRLTVPNEGSEWPLNNKFGVEVEVAAGLLTEARNRGLEPYGITFHVGSQNTTPPAWAKAIESSKAVVDIVARDGIELPVLNIGGGFPIRYTKPVPSVAEVANAIKSALAGAFPEGIGLALAPGRALLGEAGTLVTSVIGKANRGKEKWIYTNVGVFNGLMETVGGIKYPMITAKDEQVKSKWVMSGPTCDSFDVVSTDVELPELEVGDNIYIMSAGTYTTAYASEFDGFDIPKVHYIE